MKITPLTYPMIFFGRTRFGKNVPKFPVNYVTKLATANGALPFDKECVIFRFRQSFNQET